MKRLILIMTFVLTAPLLWGQPIPKFHKKLVYQCRFSNPEDLDQWVMEGPGEAIVRKGKLVLRPKYQKVVDDYFAAKGQVFDGRVVGYYKPLEEAMKKDVGEKISDYYYDGAFRGGHMVFWNKFKTPDNYILECDFRALSPHALHMLMFSCTGMADQSVFDSNLKPRCGVAAQYTKGDLKNYRISFFAPFRGTSHMRKCPGRVLTVKGTDLTLHKPKKKHHLKVVKYKSKIWWYIDRKLCFSYDDIAEEGPLGGGQTAIRLMAPAIGEYDNYRIYEILK